MSFGARAGHDFTRMTTAATTSASQRELLDAARANDEAAYHRLVEPYLRELHAHCYRMLGSLHDAEDARQDALLRAWRGLSRFDGRGSLRAWLYKIATNTCLDAIRRRDRRVSSYESIADVTWLQPYPDHLLDAAVAPGDPGEVLVARETIELTFLAVIQVLPAPQRATLILREMLGWSAKETAELLELSVPAVNSALQRARATLREQLPSEGRELWSSPEASEAERRALAGFIDAHQRGDTDAALALIADDVRVTMPASGSNRGQPPTRGGELPACAGGRRVPGLQARRPANRRRQGR
jgi:RNA polymerase sigma-70 factor (TIGR02960 family)